MASLNRVLLLGNLTRDPELRYTPGGTAACEFGLATNRRVPTAAGEAREEVCFVDVVVYGKRAEAFAKYFGKGKPVFVEGRLEFRQWSSQEGQKRSKLRVVAEDWQFVGPPSGGAGGGGRGPAGAGARQPASSPPAEEGPPADAAAEEAPLDAEVNDTPF